MQQCEILEKRKKKIYYGKKETKENSRNLCEGSKKTKKKEKKRS